MTSGTGRFPRGGVDRNIPTCSLVSRRHSRLPRGGVDRNEPVSTLSRPARCRLPRGGVDRNITSRRCRIGPLGRLPRGGVDRNTDRGRDTWIFASRLPRGGVDRNDEDVIFTATVERRLPRGGVDRNGIAQWLGSRLTGSPPARRRGSKQEQLIPICLRAGVASRTEAWIETFCARSPDASASRRLPRGGVDRNIRWTSAVGSAKVASRAEAWIETGSRTATATRPPSPPARRRGSKLGQDFGRDGDLSSPPARRRGSRGRRGRWVTATLRSFTRPRGRRRR